MEKTLREGVSMSFQYQLKIAYICLQNGNVHCHILQELDFWMV